MLTQSRELESSQKERAMSKQQEMRMTKGKFTIENPQKSSYANPEYNKEKFEKYYTMKKASMKIEENRFNSSFCND